MEGWGGGERRRWLEGMEGMGRKVVQYVQNIFINLCIFTIVCNVFVLYNLYCKEDVLYLMQIPVAQKRSCAMYKRDWIFHIILNGFDFHVILHGSEDAVRDYADSELKGWYKYSGASDKDVEAYKSIGGKIYLV